MELHYWQSQFEVWLRKNHHGQDAAHDIFHFRRVWMTSQQLSTDVTVDWLVVLTACYFHDLISLPKNHPDRHRSSLLAAQETCRVLSQEFPEFPQDRLHAVSHAIAAHTTLEAKIVQDADRLEALGAIGLARVFAVSGSLGVALFDAEDPFARQRNLDDKQYALDHFQTKLLTLPLTMQTEQGRHLAQHNADFLLTYMAKLSAELKGEYEMLDLAAIQPFKAYQ